ncbi:hypothetical protein DV495_004465 [Geotrichum candidum]|nr:hypothetical protein DV495_004465 [Geotrichum candidum]
MLFKTISLTAVYATVAVAVIGTTQQPSSRTPSVPYPIRNLTWGQLNFIHTTDTHGWLPGHLLEPSFGADWGDLISFTQHARRLADEAGVDILVVDSGDRHDGNGLSDATSPKGELTERLFTKLDYDVVSIGNHELYQWQSTVQEYEIIAPAFGERYVVSNVDLLWKDKWTPIGNKYRRFETKNQKLKVVAFGFLFDFKGNNPRTRVTRCADAVKEDWFLEALSYEDTEVFVIASHIPVRVFPEMKIIINAIRRAHPLAIIQFMGGHSHVRDFAVVDDRSTALESGRFLETIGWLSIDKVNSKSLLPIPKFIGDKLHHDQRLKPGYVTYDDYGDDGDDTLHDPWPFVILPNAVQSEQNIPESADDDTKIDVVIYDFLLPFALSAFTKIGYPVNEWHSYGGLNTVQLLTNYVNQTWPAKEVCKWDNGEFNVGAEHFLKTQGR